MWIERLRRLGCLAALVSFLAGAATPFVAVHAGYDPDLGFAGAQVLVGRATPEVGTPVPASDDEHCALCHWLHAVGTARLVPVFDRIRVQPAGLVDVVAGAAVLRPARLGPSPSRAPPASTFAI